MLQVGFLSAAVAAVLGQPAPVWDRVTTATTSEEFKTLYPGKVGEALPGCPVEVWARFDRQGLKWLRMNQRLFTPGCRDRVLADLETRFGSTTVKTGNAPTAMGFAHAYTFRQWLTPQLKIIVRAPAGADGGYTISYFKR